MDYKLLMNTAMLAGKLMLENGAETYRVEDTMHHILKTSHLEVVEILVVLTGITASISGDEVAPVTLIQGIEKRGTNLSVIEQVNQISRRYCGAEIELIDAYEELKRVESVPYPPLLAFFIPLVVAVGFTISFGGSLYDVLATLIVGLLLSSVMAGAKVIGIDGLILDIATSFGVGLMAVVMKKVMGEAITLDTVVIGSIMPLVPGVAITNAVRDTLQGDYISGCARILEAFLKAAAIALGVGVAFAIFGNGMTGGIL
ncbi:threonine/serine exporter family protein [Sellimonas intestinalis]